MATITNQATLTYNGGSANSNIATAELVETLSMTKTAVRGTYNADSDRVTYVVTISNSGTAALTGMTLTDNLGAYTFGTTTLYSLSYRTDSILYYNNGTLQTAPAVTAAAPCYKRNNRSRRRKCHRNLRSRRHEHCASRIGKYHNQHRSLKRHRTDRRFRYRNGHCGRRSFPFDKQGHFSLAGRGKRQSDLHLHHRKPRKYRRRSSRQSYNHRHLRPHSF